MKKASDREALAVFEAIVQRDTNRLAEYNEVIETVTKQIIARTYVHRIIELPIGVAPLAGCPATA